jgi:bifunctional non-homologous end joining protein LigD
MNAAIRQQKEKNAVLVKKTGDFDISISHPEKIFWPEEKISKGELVNYYESIAPFLLPHLRNRPLSLKRNPNGILDKGFYHKDAGENPPPYADVFRVPAQDSEKIIDYLVCNNTATLLYLVNLGCIEFNPWNSTTGEPNNPTWMVIDIDPSENNKFSEVVDVANATRATLKKAAVESYCKTSGASGMHVYVPMKNRYHYDIVKEFSHVIASLVNEQLPSITTLERMTHKRGDRIYIDHLQNSIGQTLASVYSIRPVEGATASAPLEWKEVKHSLHPSDFTLRNMVSRVKKKTDLFAPVLTEKTSLKQALKKLGA